MKYQLTYKAFGKQALLIEWPAKIDTAIGKDIRVFQNAISNLKIDKIVDSVIGYHSLVLKYKEELRTIEEEITLLKSTYKKSFNQLNNNSFCWEIPVCYEEQFGLDLAVVSSKTSLSVDEIIKLHSTQVYTVYFIGFLPGFLYLGGLDKRLILDRKPNPRLRVDKGAVGIGGSQTGIYPNESAGGWNIIGKTPISFFDIEKEAPCFVKSGDEIQFIPITIGEFKNIKQQAVEGSYIIQKTAIDG